MNFEIIIAIVFVVLMGLVLFFKRKKLDVQKVIFPLVYIILYRTKVGIKLMDKIASKHRELVKLFGYISIGIGYVGIFFISYSVLALMSNILSFSNNKTNSWMKINF